MTDNQKRQSAPVWIATCITLFIFFILILAISNSTDTTPKSTYEAHITDIGAIDPTTAKVLVIVKNTGKIEAAPICQISVHNESRTYQGFDTFDQLKKLKPGEQWGFSGTLTVTNQGADYVTNGSVSCT